MKKALLFILIMTAAFVQAQEKAGYLVAAFRKDYSRFSSDSALCSRYYSMVQSLKPDFSTADKTLLTGYKGAVTAIMAGHAKGQAQKMKLFSDGKSLLEQSIKKDTASTELRFLRFSLQTSCPKALGYYRQTGTDKRYIVQHLGGLKDEALRKRIAEYLLSGNYLDEQEKQKVKPALN